MFVARCQAFLEPDPFVTEEPMDKHVEAALKWQAARTPEKVMAEREAVLDRICQRDRVIKDSGLLAKWKGQVDPDVARVTTESKGPLLAGLAAETGERRLCGRHV